VRTDADIRNIARIAGLSDSFATDLIQRGATVEEARAAAFDAMADRSAPEIRTEAAPRVVVGDSFDAPEVRARAMGEALFSRVNPAHRPSDPARPYIGRTLPELAAECLRGRGITTTGLTGAAIVTRALHSTSDFPLLLGDAVGRTLRTAYEAAPSGVKAVARQSTARDFRPKSKLMLGEAPALKKVGQNGEFTRGALAEAGESYRLDTFGRIIGVTRQAIVNDDLGAFADLSRRVGAAAAEFEAAFLVDLLTAASGAGPALSDGKPLFHTNHGNLAGTGAAPTVDSLSDGRAALRRMKGLDGKTPINAAPRFILVPAALETAAEKVMAQIYAAKADDTNPLAGTLTIAVDPRLDTKSESAWYLFADPEQVEVLEYSYLENEPGPQTETRAGFDVDGVEIKVRLDFGAGAVDWRGAYRNPGSAPG